MREIRRSKVRGVKKKIMMRVRAGVMMEESWWVKVVRWVKVRWCKRTWWT